MDGTNKGRDIKTCHEKCKDKNDCHWYSYSKTYDLCLHFRTCESMNDQTEYISSQSECPHYQKGSYGQLRLNGLRSNKPILDSPKPNKCRVTGLCRVSDTNPCDIGL